MDDVTADVFSNTVERLRAMNRNGLRPQVAKKVPPESGAVHLEPEYPIDAAARTWETMSVEDAATHMVEMELDLLRAFEDSVFNHALKATLLSSDDVGNEAVRAMIAVEKQLSKAEGLASTLQKAVDDEAHFARLYKERKAWRDATAEVVAVPASPFTAATRFLSGQAARDSVVRRELAARDSVLSQYAIAIGAARRRQRALNRVGSSVEGGDLAGIRAASFGEKILELRQSRTTARRAWEKRDADLAWQAANRGAPLPAGMKPVYAFDDDKELVEQFYRFHLADEQLKAIEKAGARDMFWTRASALVEENLVVDARAAYVKSRPFTKYDEVPADEAIYYGTLSQRRIGPDGGPSYNVAPLNDRHTQLYYVDSKGRRSFPTRAEQEAEARRNAPALAETLRRKAERKRQEAIEELRLKEWRMAKAMYNTDDLRFTYAGRSALADSDAAWVRVQRQESVESAMLTAEVMGRGRRYDTSGAVMTTADGSGGKSGRFGVRVGDSADAGRALDEGEGHLNGFATNGGTMGQFSNDKGTQFNGIVSGDTLLGQITPADGVTRNGMLTKDTFAGQVHGSDGSLFNGFAGNDGSAVGQVYDGAGGVQSGIGVNVPVDFATETADAVADAMTSSSVSVHGIVDDLAGRRYDIFGGGEVSPW